MLIQTKQTQEHKQDGTITTQAKHKTHKNSETNTHATTTHTRTNKQTENAEYDTQNNTLTQQTQNNNNEHDETKQTNTETTNTETNTTNIISQKHWTAHISNRSNNNQITDNLRQTHVRFALAKHGKIGKSLYSGW